MALRFSRNAESERGAKLRGLEPLIRHFVTPSPQAFFQNAGGEGGAKLTTYVIPTQCEALTEPMP